MLDDTQFNNIDLRSLFFIIQLTINHIPYKEQVQVCNVSVKQSCVVSYSKVNMEIFYIPMQ